MALRTMAGRSWRAPAGRRAGPVAALAVLSAAVLASSAWGGPGVSSESLAWTLLAGVSLLSAVALVLASPGARGAESRAWGLIAAGILLHGVAGAWLAARVRADPEVPVPFWTDAVWVIAYGCLVAGVSLVGRGGRPRPPLSVLVDGALVGFAVLALGAATALDDLTRELGVETLRAATALTYPLWGLVLVGVVAGVMGGGGRGRERRWHLLGCAALLLTVADVAYLHRAVDGDFSAGAWYHPLYLLAWAAIALASWIPADPVRASVASFRWRILAPGVAAGTASAVLVWDHFEPRSEATIVFCSLTLLAALLRIMLTFRELEQLSQAQRLALTDDLTLLPNRRRLLQELVAATQGSEEFALLVLDVDRFKEINDTLGHDVGDRLLAEVGRRLRAGLPPWHHLARLGGDEFAVLTAPGSSATEAAQEAVHRIQTALAAPIPLDGVSLPVRASVGIALSPQHGTDAESLLKRADVAMYQAKAAGSGWEVYSTERDGFTLERLSLGADLHGAAERGELRLVYQPIIDPLSGRMLRAEALLRWQHPSRGLLEPGEFIVIAEQAGLMRMITPAVLRMAVARCEAWQQDGLRVGVAVNLAASDLLDPAFPEVVRAVLADSGIDPAMLQLEITERGVLADRANAVEVLKGLRALGVGVAIDDYGTGNASIAHLRGLPVDEIKIDRSFVAGVARNHDDAAIVRSTIVLGHELGLRVVAEGVEDPDVLDLVTDWGADAVQGFLLGRPAEGDALVARGVGQPSGPSPGRKRPTRRA